MATKRKPKGKSGIHIAKSKEGSFTAWCKANGFNVKNGVPAACISAGKKAKSAAIRKKANFASSAKKWKH